MTQTEQTKMLTGAYVLLCDFYETIHSMLEGDHPSAKALDNWLTLYERMTPSLADVENVEGVPV